jgi:hypothetical protein
MKIVYDNKKTKLVNKTKDTWDLSVEWQGQTKKFWINFPFPLMKIIATDNIDEMNRKFTIKADSIKPLKLFLKERKGKISYEDGMQFLFDIGNQIQTLERFSLGIPFIKIEDIIVIDNRHFFYLDDSKVLDINRITIDIEEPYKISMFFSPEFKNIKGLPAEISYKTSYYSLASLIVFCMFNAHVEVGNKDILKPIYTTKLYWALDRMLQDDPKDRFYLII